MSPSADRRIRLALGTWASVVFLALWVGAAMNLIGGGQPAADAWRAFTSFPGAAQGVAWLILLPMPASLWASQTEMPTFVACLVVIAVMAWTAAAWGGLARATLRRRSRLIRQSGVGASGAPRAARRQ